MACKTSGQYRLEMVNDMAVKMGTKRTFVCTADKATQYTVYSYKFNITGDVDMDYDNSGNLIVTLKNGFIQPAGSGSWPSQRPFEAPWYGSLSGPMPCWRSIAMAISPVNDAFAVPADQWHKCLGGWYSAGTNCDTTCTKDRYGNPPGGTYMWWSDTQAGTAWEKTQHQRGGRNIPTQTWNLGQIQSRDGKDLQLYAYARLEQACVWQFPGCANMPYVDSSIPQIPLTAPVCPLDPPVYTGNYQEQRVCDNCVDVYMQFEPSDLGGRDGGKIVVDYKYGDEPWDVALHTSEEMDVVAGQEITVLLRCLIPDRKVCWRAQFLTGEGETAKSEYSYGCFQTEFIPPVWMTVPPVSVQECTLLQQGRPVKPFDHLTNYWGDEL